MGELDREELDAKAETKNSLGWSHVFYTTKYGSEVLLGMNTMVSTVEGTQGENNRLFRHQQILELQLLSFHGIRPITSI